MLIFPAIDLKGGRCVRLRQGVATDATVYSDDPVQMARQWVERGATYLHVVDLDGAFQGRPVHGRVIANIVRELSIPVEVGGGLRTDADIAEALGWGVTRAIIGTWAFQEPDVLRRLAERHGELLAVGIDARGGFVQVKGWVETTGMKAVDLAKQADGMGVGTLIYTDTSKDGMLAGVNAEAMAEMCDAVSCHVVASGGVSTVADVRTLVALRRANLEGAIVGKALYEGRVELAELNKAAAGA